MLNKKTSMGSSYASDCRQTPEILEFAYSLFSFKIEVTQGRVDFHYERTLSAGTASAASLAALSPGSSARAVPLESPFFAPINGAPYKMNELMDMMTKNQ